MSLTQPWWLLLLALLPVIIALHSRRRRSLTVPSLLIWQQVATVNSAARPARRLPRPNLPLILQLLAVTVLALSLAQPVLQDTRPPDHWLVLIEAPADRAATAQLLSTNSRSLLTMVEVSGAPTVRALRVQDRRLPVLDQPVLSDEPADWPAAIRLASGTVLDGEDTLVTVIGTPASVREAASLLARLLPEARTAFTVVGEDLPNNRFSHVELTELNGGMSVSGTVAADSELIIRFEPAGGGQTLTWSALATTDRSFDVALELPGAGELSLSLPDDAVPADNVIRFQLLDQSRPTRFAWDSASAAELERALLAAGAQPADQKASQLLVAAGPSADAQLVWGAVTEPARLTDNRLQVHPHRLTRGIDFSGLQLERSAVLDTQPGDEVLLSVPDGPVALLRTGTAPAQVLTGFGPADSNWSALPSFPAFVARVTELFDPGAGSRLGRHCVVGLPCNVPAGAEIVAPDGTLIEPLLAGSFEPEQGGRYTVAGEPLHVNVMGPVRQPAATGLPDQAAGGVPVRLLRWLALATALIVLAELALAVSGRSAAAGRRGWLPLGLQGLAVIMLLAAAARPELPLPVRTPVTAFITGSAAAAPPDLTVVLGGDADTVRARPAALADALRLTAGLLPRGGTVLVDAPAAVSEAGLSRTAAELRNAGLTVDLQVPASTGPETSAAWLSAPAGVQAGAPFVLSAGVHADSAGPAELTLLRAGVPVAQQQVELRPGLNQIDFTVVDSEGDWLYTFSVEAAADTVTGNNSHGTFVQVLPAPNVAVVTQQAAAGDVFASALRLQGLHAEVMRPVFVPRSAAELAVFDAVVLLDLPARELHSSQQDALAEWVRELGGGLLILGGANTFGPGGYWQTPLEDVSPLSSLVDRESPQVALLFVLDRSGSMLEAVGDTNRLEIAKAATLGAIEALNEESQVGIIMFDSNAEVLVPLQSAAGPEPFEAALATLNASGGTNIYPALQHAAAQLRDVEASARHVIVMTDGLSRPGDFPGIIRELRELGATVSTVAIGEGADAAGLANLARLGSGSTHATTDFRALPSILGQEALLLSGSSFEELTVQPVWHADAVGPDFSFLATVAPLHGFVRTTAKEAATLHLSSTDAEGESVPLLASWRYGLGNVAAFASQAAGPWAASWQAQADYPALWTQLVRWAATPPPAAGLDVETELSGDTLLVTVSALDADLAPLNGLALEAVLLDPDGNTADTVLLQPAGNGTYSGRLLATEPGTYWLGAGVRGLDDGAVEPVELPLYIPYPQHLNGGAARPELLQQLAAVTGGDPLAPASATASFTTLWLPTDATVLCLLVAGCALLLALWRRYRAGG